MGKIVEKMERILEWGGTPKDITCLALGGISLVISIFDLYPSPLTQPGLRLFYADCLSLWRR